MKRTYYSIVQEAREADIFIFGNITSYPYRPGDYSAGSLVQEIKDLDADIINVHVDSYGGSVKEGWGIYNALKSHPAKINTYADGFVASAALFPFLAGGNRYASSVSAFYLHEVSLSVDGYASDLREAADDAEKMTKIGIGAFTETTGVSEAKIKELMARETWLDPKEAMELHIATAILSEDPGQSFSQSVLQAMISALRGTRQQPAPHPPQIHKLSQFFNSERK